ncbi:Leucine-tRNA ligase [Venturia nashicola]|nr:Leucine-tRNA ligase [Venturia nashicola]
MAGRRNGNAARIRGPQSALTDFLAANNISAQQIRDDYLRRRTQAEEDAAAAEPEEDEEAMREEQEAAEAAIRNARTRRRRGEEVKATIKKGKGKAKDKGKGKKKKKGSDDEDESDFEDDVMNMYKKVVKLPGQLENCELCSKRFTVTPYSKTGPDGGLLCTPCGKELAKDAKVGEAKPKAKGPMGRKRRKIESDRLDGKIQHGAKTLQQLCIEKVAKHAGDIDDLGDLPPQVLERLSEIFTKNRVMKPRVLDLFLRADVETIVVHDCAYLGSDDFKKMFAIQPLVEKVVLGNACQFKNDTMEYMTERATKLQHLHLYAANLISDAVWTDFFMKRGENMKTIKLAWLDAAFEDKQVEDLVKYCPNLERLKLKRCRRLGFDSIIAISHLRTLRHLSLQVSQHIPNEILIQLIRDIGPNLETLSLEDFKDLDDIVIEAIGFYCRKLKKFRMKDNDTVTDSALAVLFSNWLNPPLHVLDVSINRDVDNSNPDGPEEAIGIAAASFTAMMAHSASKIAYLNVSSCRHISYSALIDVFDGKKQYPELKEIDLSFVSAVDTLVLAGLFKSAPQLRKVVAFGCFQIEDVVVPAGVVVIGVPRAQDAIEKFGDGAVEEALGRMVAMYADSNHMEIEAAA